MQLKTHAIQPFHLDTLSSSTDTFSIVATIPSHCFDSPQGISARVDLEYGLENEIPTWQVKRQSAGQTVGGFILAEDAIVYELWPVTAREREAIRHLFWSASVSLGLSAKTTSSLEPAALSRVH